MSMIDIASIAYGIKHNKPQDKQTNKKARRQIGKQANKKGDKQVKRQTKGGVHLDKCRFGSDVHSFIMLKYEQHTSKQDSCMDMWANV